MKTKRPILRPWFTGARGVVLGVLLGALPAGAQPLQWDLNYTPQFTRTSGVPAGARLYPLSDGTFLLTGAFSQLAGAPAPGIARLTASGARDAGFLFSGAAVTPADHLVPLDDGRFLLLRAAPDEWTKQPVVRVSRHLADGTNDPAFGEMTMAGSAIVGVLRASGGRHVLYGRIAAVDGAPREGLARLAADGTLDTGYAPALLGPGTVVTGAVSAEDGSVIVAAALGAGGASVFWARFDANGGRDPVFAPAVRPGKPLAIQSGGKVICGGTTPVRLNPDGTVDAGFFMWVPPGGPFNVPSLDSAVVLPDGRFLADISVYGDFGMSFGVSRRTADGASLGTISGGELHTTAPDGRIVFQHRAVSGIVYSRAELASRESGSPTFTIAAADLATTTSLQPSFGFPGLVARVRFDAAQRAVVSGQFSSVDGLARAGLARIAADGTIDAGFTPPDNLGPLQVVAVEPGGHVWVHHPDPADIFGFLLKRLNLDGSHDASLPSDSELCTAHVRLFERDASDRILAAVLVPDPGDGLPRIDIAYFDPATGARTATWPTTLTSWQYAMSFFTSEQPRDGRELADGSLIVDGTFREVVGQNLVYEVNGIPIVGGPLKLRPDGAVDAAYRAKLVALGVINTHQLLPDGRALVNIPQGTTGITTVRTIRIDASGDVDPGFQLPPGETTLPQLDLQADGSFVALGPGLRRWREDGSRDLNSVPTFAESVLDAAKLPNSDWFIVGTFGLRHLVPTAANGITLPPAAQAVAIGQVVRFFVEIGDAGIATFQWQRNGVDLPGATQSTLELGAATVAHAGFYRVIVQVGGATYTSEPAELRVRSSSAHLTNFSARSRVSPGTPQIAGFVLRAATPRPVLLRAVGMGLAFVEPGLDLLPDGRLGLFFRDTVLDENRGGVVDSVIGNLGQQVHAFVAAPMYPLLFPDTNFGSALAPALADGNYTAHTTSNDDHDGISLFEFYDAAEAIEPGFVINVSLRGRTAPGADTMIGGFVITGQGTLTLLLRAVGPELAQWDVPDVLADPQLTLFNGTQTTGANDDWSNQINPGPMTIDAATTATGAFPLAPASKSAAVVVSLAAGAYTVHATGAGATAGEVLLEIYLLAD